jgi:hypothetical protein
VCRFLRGRPSSVPTPAHLLVRSWPMPPASSGRCHVGPGASWTPPVSLTSSRAGNCYAPDSLPLKPVPFLCCDTAGHHWPNSHRRAVHPSPPRATRTPTCAPTTLSHRVGCGAPWRPIATGHCGGPWHPIATDCCSATACRCSIRDARARSSTMKSHAACPAS